MNDFAGIYILHIPKTAGRYIKQNLQPFLDFLEKDYGVPFVIESEQKFNTNHHGWHSKITDEIYVITSFRDPVKQAISFYAHGKSFNINNERRVPVGMPFINKENFLKWFEENKDHMTNNQSKHLLFGKLKNADSFLTRDGHLNESGYENINTFSYDDVLTKINRVNAFVRTDKIDLQKIIDKILFDMEISEKFIFDEKVSNKNFLNEDAVRIYNDLFDNEKEYINNINNIDYKIWNNDLLFTKLGEQ